MTGFDSSCRLLIVSFFRGRSRVESLVLSHHSRFTWGCNEEEINEDDDVGGGACGRWARRVFARRGGRRLADLAGRDPPPAAR